MARLAAVTTENTDPYAARERHHNEGHGRRLTAAFEALEAFPVLAESRNRVMRLFEAGDPPTAEVVTAVESDVALAVAVMRLANQIDGRKRGRVESAVEGVEVLSPQAVHAIASRARTFDFFERTAVWQGIPERFRLHAVATQQAADRVAREIEYEFRDRLMITSLLHDVGKLVLVHAYPGYVRRSLPRRGSYAHTYPRRWITLGALPSSPAALDSPRGPPGPCRAPTTSACAPRVRNRAAHHSTGIFEAATGGGPRSAGAPLDGVRDASVGWAGCAQDARTRRTW